MGTEKPEPVPVAPSAAADWGGGFVSEHGLLPHAWGELEVPVRTSQWERGVGNDRALKSPPGEGDGQWQSVSVANR